MVRSWDGSLYMEKKGGAKAPELNVPVFYRNEESVFLRGLFGEKLVFPMGIPTGLDPMSGITISWKDCE